MCSCIASLLRHKASVGMDSSHLFWDSPIFSISFKGIDLAIIEFKESKLLQGESI